MIWICHEKDLTSVFAEPANQRGWKKEIGYFEIATLIHFENSVCCVLIEGTMKSMNKE